MTSTTRRPLPTPDATHSDELRTTDWYSGLAITRWAHTTGTTVVETAHNARPDTELKARPLPTVNAVSIVADTCTIDQHGDRHHTVSQLFLTPELARDLRTQLDAALADVEATA